MICCIEYHIQYENECTHQRLSNMNREQLKNDGDFIWK
jgi:hypothetical protein